MNNKGKAIIFMEGAKAVRGKMLKINRTEIGDKLTRAYNKLLELKEEQLWITPQI